MIDLIPFLLLAAACWKIKLVSPLGSINDNYNSKETGTMLRGFFAVIIVIGHISYLVNSGRIFHIFNTTGYQTAAFFFFLSGFGLIKSLDKDSGYLNGFIPKKIRTLIIPYLILCLIYWAVNFLIKEPPNTLTEVLRSFISGTPVVDNSWYLILCLLFYLSFYIFAKLFNKNKILIAASSFVLCICLVFLFKYLGWGTWWYDSNYGYAAGMLWAIFDKNIAKAAQKLPVYILMLLAAIVCWFITFRLGLRFYSLNHQFVRINAVFLSLIVFLFVMKIKLGSPILKFYGRISLELYLIHGLIIRLLRSDYIYISNDLLWGLSIIAASTAAAYLLHKLFSFLSLSRNREKPSHS